MFTKKEHVKLLAKSMIARLEADDAIALNPRDRQAIADELFSVLDPMILTDDDVRARILKEMGLNADTLVETGSNESDQYRAARNVIMSKVGENALNGFYYQKPVRNVAIDIGKFLMKNKFVEEVFPADDELEKSLVDFLKRFNPEQLH